MIQIVRILDFNFSCFNTKKRVPYKIVVETIDMNDLLRYEQKATD